MGIKKTSFGRSLSFFAQLGNPYPNRSYHQTRAHSRRVAAEKEEQRHTCALTFEKKSEQAIQSLLRRGAGDRTRTGTQKPARDFKSLVSTIPPHRQAVQTILAPNMQAVKGNTVFLLCRYCELSKLATGNVGLSFVELFTCLNLYV